VIHERLVAEYGFAGHYQRVKIFAAEARPRIAAELAQQDENPLTGLHRRFEVLPGAQSQVDRRHRAWDSRSRLIAQPVPMSQTAGAVSSRGESQFWKSRR
jgi:hypothetical protein